MTYYQYHQLQNVCFDTGIVPTQNTRIEVDNAGIVTNGTWPGIITSEGTSEWGQQCTVGITGSQLSNYPAIGVRFGDQSIEASGSSPQITIVDGQLYNLTLDKDEFTIDGTSYALGGNFSQTATATFVIGGRHIQNTDERRVAPDDYIGDVRIYDNGVLVAEFRPSVNNGEYTYFDTVSQTYATKYGSGTVTPGPSTDVFEPSQDTFSFGYSGGTQTFSIEATYAWTCTTPEDFTLSPTSGNPGTTTVTITAPSRFATKSETVTFTDAQSNTFDISIAQSVGTTSPNLTLYRGTATVNKMYYGDSLVYRKLAVSPGYLCFTAEQSGSTVSIMTYRTDASIDTPVLYYSFDKEIWGQWDYSPITLANVGDKVYFYGTNNYIGYDNSNYSSFQMSGRIAASGDVTTLLTRNGTTKVTHSHCFAHLFDGCTSLTTAPALPATTLTMACYESMFNGCTALTAAPALPATTMKISCYATMFQGCTSLTTAPALPATTLASYCYQRMFQGCTSLTTAPALPATTLESVCYDSMFNGCTSLTTAPALPATTLATMCYYSMFQGCSSLASITCLAEDISAFSCTNNWLQNVSATGTFTKSANMSGWTTGDNGIPSGWTVVDA